VGDEYLGLDYGIYITGRNILNKVIVGGIFYESTCKKVLGKEVKGRIKGGV
jgi:hypothetical protein